MGPSIHIVYLRATLTMKNLSHGALLLSLLAIVLGAVAAQEQDDERIARPCNSTLCVLPECACPGSDIPGGLTKEEVPQMVLVMFDGRLSEGGEKMIRRLFPKTRTNPNKCPIVSTFFVSNENTDYCSVNRLWAEGHEIGVNALTRHDISYWQEADADQWEAEISRQEENLEEKAGISVYSLEGWRTPHLQPGGDIQYYTLNINYYYTYDNTLTIPVRKAIDKNASYWPFTLDYSFQKTLTEYCHLCPVKSHPGLWELPLAPLWDSQRNLSCTYLHACPTLRDKPIDTYNLLHDNFHRHFTGNRAPFMINVSPRWLMDNEEAAKGLENFIVDMVKEEEVWFVSGAQAIQWTRRPRTLGQLDSFTPWGCFKRRYKQGCEPRDGFNSSVKLFPGLISDGGRSLLLWQYLTLAAVFLILYQYDRRRK